MLLTQYQGEPTPLNLVCPHRKQYSPAVQQLHALLRSRLNPLKQELPPLASDPSLIT